MALSKRPRTLAVTIYQCQADGSGLSLIGQRANLRELTGRGKRKATLTKVCRARSVITGIPRGLPVDTYSVALKLRPSAGWSYHVPGFCFTLNLGPHSSPGYLEDALGSQNWSPDSQPRVRNPLPFSLSLLDQAY